jgi:membrane protease YdiL (CAAX protease family)
MSTVSVIAVASAAVRLTHASKDTRGATAVIGECALAAITFLAGTRAAGGLKRFISEVGLDWPDRADLLRWLRGIGMQLIALVVYAVVIVAINPNVAQRVSNTTELQHAPHFALITTAFAAVVIAPLVEETLFRGLLLQASAARCPFLESAVRTSLLFGLLHVWQVHNLAAAAVLGGRQVTFGVIQCVLVRPTGRLGGNILVHATANFVALALAAR